MIKTDFKCKNCGKCCKELNCFVNLDDVHRWMDEDRMDIVSCLTWHFLRGRMPPDILFIPRKAQLRGHSWLRRLYIPEWLDNTECIFLLDGKCSIYKTRPTSCQDFPKTNLNFNCPGISNVNLKDKALSKIMITTRHNQNLLIFKNRETISKMIKTAKEMTSQEKLKKIIRGDEKSDTKRDPKQKEEGRKTAN